MNKTDFNDSFSVEDIHKLRGYHYEKTKNFTGEELIDEINGKADVIR